MKTGHKTASIEIIEIIDDDSGAFGDRQRNVTVADTGGPRWIGPAAAVALVSLIGYGVATSTSTSGPPKTAATTTTSIAAPTAEPTPTISIPSATADAYYSADPPEGFAIEYANVQWPDHMPFQGYGYELWATPAASATSGRWFSVATYSGPSMVAAADAYRLQAGQLSIAISHLASGQTLTQFTEPGRTGVTITSFGWSDDDLVRLATSTQADRSSVGFTDAWFMPEHQMISAVQPWLAVQSVPAEQIAYLATDDPASSIVVTIGQRLQPNEVATTDRQIALRFLLDPNTPFTVDGQQAVAGKIVGQGDRALASWITGDHVITVSAAMPISQLITVARTVHQVSAREWDGMRFRAENRQVDESRFEKGPAHKLASGSDSRADIWVATANAGDQQQISWSWANNGLVTTPDDTPQIHTMVDNDRTYVLADLPRASSPAGFLKVIRDGHQIVMPFIDIDPRADRTFAAYSFAEPGPFTVEVIGADRKIRVTWPVS